MLAREQRRAEKQKKKAENLTGPNAKVSSSTSKAPAQPSAPKKTAVWVSNLPPNTTPQLLASVFSKAGVLLIGDDGEPRIKMYYDDEGKFKGDALIMYFKEGSVDLAITLLDDTELEMGAGFGNMRVKAAEYDKTQAQGGEEKKAAPAEKEGGQEKKRKPPTAEEKARMSKRIKKMQEWVVSFGSDASLTVANSPGTLTTNQTKMAVQTRACRSQATTVLIVSLC